MMRNLKYGLAVFSSLFMVCAALNAQAQDVRSQVPQVAVESVAGDSQPSSKTIEWCRLQHPQVVTVTAAEESDLIFGQIFIQGCTEGGKNCKGVKAEFGYGIRNEDPRTFKYLPAGINPKFATNTKTDEYMLRVRIEQPGEYAMLYRFSTDNGKTWVYCDFDDEPGFNNGKTGTLIVKPKE